MSREYTCAIVIGRFQPVHAGHELLINEALKLADDVIVLVGSSFQSPSVKNPFSFEDRSRMIKLATPSNRIIIKPIKDYAYNDTKWMMDVQSTIDSVIYKQLFNTNPKVCLVGFSKDEATTSYLNEFRQYDYKEVESTINVDATTIREMYFEEPEGVLEIGVLSAPVRSFLHDWSKSAQWGNLHKEHKSVTKTRTAWKFSPYEPTFVTTDAILVESGHILLVRRGEYPGKGLWALPGGYLEADEDIITSCVREVHEETQLDIPKRVLRGSITKQKVFANPGRDPRGRFVTHAFLFELSPCPDPKQKFSKVTAADDAEHAEWVPLSSLRNMEAEFFLDHYAIINDMIGG